MCDPLSVVLPDKPLDHPASRIDEDLRWPPRHAVGIPHAMISIVHHRMRNAMAVNGLLNMGSGALVIVLGGVDANDHEFSCKHRLQALEVRQNVQAVDTTVSPKIEENDLAPQLPETERLIRIDPFGIHWKFRGRSQIHMRQ
jgi:hypothetical protein